MAVQDLEVVPAGEYLIPCQLEHMIQHTKSALCQTQKWERKEEKKVTDEIMKEWDPLWNEVNEEFEMDLQNNPKFDNPKLSNFVGHFFFVWEGNHRTVAWIQAIKEKISTSKDKHCRVLCTIIDPTRVPKIVLLSSLQRMNFMNSHSLVTMHLRDEIVNLTHICAADSNVYLKALPEKDQKLIADLRKYYSKGDEPWYPLTQKYLARLVYDVHMTKEYNIRVDQLSRESLAKEDLKKEEKKIYHDLTTKYSDKIEKLFNIVDPHLGSDWLGKVLSLRWGLGSWTTLEKINLIAIVDAPIQNKLLWLSLLEADNLTKTAYGIKKGDAAYRTWLRREGLLARVYDRALQLVTYMLGTCGDIVLSADCTFMFYFEEIKLEAMPHLFPLEVSLEMRTKDVDKQVLKKLDTLRMVAQRLAYRFLNFFVSRKILPFIPLLARKWTELKIPNSCLSRAKGARLPPRPATQVRVPSSDNVSMHGHIRHDFDQSIAVTGDYIVISGDFSLEILFSSTFHMED
ncbi:hypothetical protein GOP47_0001833 [Adiantum capillus-veneris]|uniref:Uncharacterized protein n=1 Tax=Adiantum capillus-veneris TaxID=13818 RepID=A0A9D4ZR25_ADICA|nr:hypothetical protein GOP47_0001833 [Adiantum capillus-veneris]